MKKLLTGLIIGIPLVMLTGCILGQVEYKLSHQNSVVLEKNPQDYPEEKWQYALHFSGVRWYVPHPAGFISSPGYFMDISDTIFLNKISGKVDSKDVSFSGDRNGSSLWVRNFFRNQFLRGNLKFNAGKVWVDLKFRREDKISIMRRFSDVGAAQDSHYSGPDGSHVIVVDTRAHVFHGYVKEFYPEYRTVDRHGLMAKEELRRYRKLDELGLGMDEEFRVYNKAIHDENLSIAEIEARPGINVIYKGTLGEFSTGFQLKKLLPNLWSHGSVSARLPKHPRLLISVSNESEEFDFNGEYKINDMAD